MNCTLKRTQAKSSGIFGTMTMVDGCEWSSLEHAYIRGMDWAPKLPPGVYSCIRGQHQLHSGPIETFEVKGVPGHSGILIHPGNTEAASEGCILLGMARSGDSVIDSKAAFKQFMDLQDGVDEFQLTVVG